MRVELTLTIGINQVFELVPEESTAGRGGGVVRLWRWDWRPVARRCSFARWRAVGRTYRRMTIVTTAIEKVDPTCIIICKYL